MAQYTTLKNFLASNNNRSLEQNNEDLQNVLNDLAEASISVSKDISRAGLIDGFWVRKEVKMYKEKTNKSLM